MSTTTKAYEIAREIALSGDYTLLSEVLDELAYNWSSTYKETIKELKETLQWHEED